MASWWPWVPRSRLDEEQRFWMGLLNQAHATCVSAIKANSRYVDRIVELTAEVERLKQGAGKING